MKFSHPEDFNDPFELWSNPHTLQDRKRIIEEFAEGDARQHPWQPPPERRNLETPAQRELRAQRKDSTKFFRELFADRFFIFCAAKEWDNVLMWAHYTHSFKGVVVEIDSNQTPTNVSSPREVKYSGSLPCASLLSENYAREIACTKAEIWKYEKEWRFFVPKPPEMTQVEKEPAFILFKQELITSVMLGPEAEVEFIEKLSQILDQARYANVKKYHVRPKSNLYGLDRQNVVTYISAHP